MKKVGYGNLLLILFLIISFLPSANAELVSTFDSGDEGWGAWSSDPLDVSGFQWNSTGGNPGGYVSAVDGMTGAVWRFSSPDSWAGDWTQYIGGTIEWDILLIEAPELVYFENKELIIDAPDTGNYILADVNAVPVLGQWVHFSVDLKPENFTQEGTRDFYDIVANVEKIYIRGEFITGADSEGLDNVVVSAVPIPTTLLLLGSGLLGIVGLRRK